MRASATLELPQIQANLTYDPARIVESFWLEIWTGTSRYIHSDWLRQDEIIADRFSYEIMVSEGGFLDQRRAGFPLASSPWPRGRRFTIGTASQGVAV
jgi:hypothetical protein